MVIYMAQLPRCLQNSIGKGELLIQTLYSSIYLIAQKLLLLFSMFSMHNKGEDLLL